MITLGNTDNGNWSKVNKEMATKAISLVNGVSVVARNTANVVSDTKNGIEDHVKFWLAVKTPIFLSVANSRSFLMKEIYYRKLVNLIKHYPIVSYLLHERILPSIQLDNLDTIENFILIEIKSICICFIRMHPMTYHKLYSCILVTHLSLL